MKFVKLSGNIQLREGRLIRQKAKILWVDDEIELLRAHVRVLEERGYEVHTVPNAEDALAILRERTFDAVLLDEMLNGMDGLSALIEIKEMHPSLPVIMVTKSEEESLMEEAIGSKIDDYLTKPVNPSQIILTLKRVLEKRKIERERISRKYTQEFAEISAALSRDLTWREWVDIAVRLAEWEVQIDAHPEVGLREILQDQRRECNAAFGRFVEENYQDWVWDRAEDRPPLSPDVFVRWVAPLLREGRKVLFVVIDNVRLDQWFGFEDLLFDTFRVRRDYYLSILPTATPFSRNAIFAGLFPVDIERIHPELWLKGPDDELSRNRYEGDLLNRLVRRLNIDLLEPVKYAKVVNVEEARKFEREFGSLSGTSLIAVVFNFVDILVHRRSDSEVLKQIAPDEAAFRSLTRSWFEHSYLLKVLREAARLGYSVVMTSDHGCIRGMRGTKVIGDRETSTNLRYKYGKNLKVNPKHAIVVKDPRGFKLPARGVNANYLIAKEDYYFVYPTNYHHYLAQYRDSFQHGGVSLEEMVLPVLVLEPAQ